MNEKSIQGMGKQIPDRGPQTESELRAAIAEIEQERKPVAEEYADSVLRYKVVKDASDLMHRSAFSRGTYVPDRDVFRTRAEVATAKRRTIALKSKLEKLASRLKPLKRRLHEEYSWRGEYGVAPVFVEVATRLLDPDSLTRIWAEVRGSATARCVECNALSPLGELTQAGAERAYYHPHCMQNLDVGNGRVVNPQRPGDYESGASNKERYGREWRDSAYRQGR